MPAASVGVATPIQMLPNTPAIRMTGGTKLFKNMLNFSFRGDTHHSSVGRAGVAFGFSFAYTNT